jgi:hypothetical protein
VIPVDQTAFGEGVGNCFSACVASILHVPLADVPTFCIHDDWWERFLAWLWLRGLYAIGLKYNPEYELAGYHILSGKSPRGEFEHSVVARRDKIVHDPHPSRDGLRSFTDCIIILPMDHGEFTRTNS